MKYPIRFNYSTEYTCLLARRHAIFISVLSRLDLNNRSKYRRLEEIKRLDKEFDLVTAELEELERLSDSEQQFKERNLWQVKPQ